MAGETAVETPAVPEVSEEKKEIAAEEAKAAEAGEKKDEEKSEKKAEKKAEKKEKAPPPPAVHKKDFEKDVVYMYQFGRTPALPSLSPHCLKLESWLKLNGIKYEVGNVSCISFSFPTCASVSPVYFASPFSLSLSFVATCCFSVDLSRVAPAFPFSPSFASDLFVHLTIWDVGRSLQAFGPPEKERHREGPKLEWACPPETTWADATQKADEHDIWKGKPDASWRSPRA